MTDFYVTFGPDDAAHGPVDQDIADELRRLSEGGVTLLFYPHRNDRFCCRS